MQRFKGFPGRSLDEAALRDAGVLEGVGARPRWVPDELEEFDEVELAVGLDDDRDLTISMALENGALARLLFGWVPAGDEDEDPRAFDADALAAALDLVGDRVVALLTRILE